MAGYKATVAVDVVGREGVKRKTTAEETGVAMAKTETVDRRKAAPVDEAKREDPMKAPAGILR